MALRPLRGAPCRVALLSSTCALLCGTTPALQAQQVAGSGQDAVVLPRGVFRLSVGTAFEDADERFSSLADGTPSGTRQPYGAPFTAGAFRAANLGNLGEVQQRIRTMTGLPTLELSLGDVRVQASAQRVTVPLLLELGVGRRLQLSAMIPYVRTRTLAEIRADPLGLTGNAGINPTFLGGNAGTTNAALVTQLRNAADAVDQALASCPPGAMSGPCADPVAAALTRDAARSLATDIAEVFGVAQQGGSRIVPVSGSSPAAALSARIEQLRTGFTSMGIEGPPAGAMPALAATAPTAPQVEQLLATQAALGIAPIADVSRYGVGDIEVGVRLQLVDPFGGDVRAATRPVGANARVAVGALVRAGTGSTDDPTHLVDIGVGDGQHDVEVNGTADILFGSRFWTSVTGRYGVQLPHERVLRVPETAGQIFVPAENARLVRRDPGDYLALEVVPRYAITSIISLDGHYLYRRKAQDAFTLAAGESPDLDATLLGIGTEGYEHRAGMGVTVSTVSTWARGEARLPLDVSYVHLRTVAGGGAEVLRTRRDQIMLRIYLGLFGRR